MTSLLEKIKAYVGFGADDAELLLRFEPSARPHLQRIAERFYDSIARDPEAEAVLRGDAQIARLKQSLADWLATGLAGPHDQAYYERRTRIGRVHVKIALPQRYMLTAMNVVRAELHDVVEATYVADAPKRRSTSRAIDRWLDIELAIMLETYKEDSESQLMRQARLASMGQLAGTIGHELRNPLGVIESSLYLVRQRVAEDSKVVRHLDKIAGQVHNASRIITDLLDMTRDRPASREKVDVGALLDRALTSRAALPDGVILHKELDHETALFGDPNLLERALENVISNSIQAFEGGGGNVWVEFGRGGSGEVLLRVRDDGPGFGEEILSRALEPLVTSRSSGVGLGLALVRNVCIRHGGSVEVDNHAHGGAVVTFRLPRGASTARWA